MRCKDSALTFLTVCLFEFKYDNLCLEIFIYTQKLIYCSYSFLRKTYDA